MTKRWTFKTTDEAAVSSLHEQLRINPIFCKLLVQRGITNFDEAKRFFRPEWSHLHSPFLMKDMDKAASRLISAIEQNEKILIYGDYDVDGTTSVAMMYRFLAQFCKEERLDYYLPDRYREGYGLSFGGVDYANEIGATLMIALDCGIRGHAAIAYANYKHIDIIVCDHHLPEATLPPAYAVLDPQRTDCEYPCKYLSGCAVGWKLAQAVTGLRDLPEERYLIPLLDFVALSLACDLVPLRDETRTLAYFGLKQLNEQPSLGIKTLKNTAARGDAFSISDVVFGIGPLINAAGRLTDAREAVKLLLCNDTAVAQDYARRLAHLNMERRDIERAITAEVIEKCENDPDFVSGQSVVLADATWAKGVIGIVAARAAETFHRPAIIFADAGNGKHLTGSARSVKGFDLHEALIACADLCVSFGGHAHAAGLTIENDKLDEFKARFDAVVKERLSDEMREPEQLIDVELPLSELTTGFWRIMKQFAPFGPKNMRPVFAAMDVKDAGGTALTKDVHLKLHLMQADSAPVSGMAFFNPHPLDAIKAGKHFDLAYVVDEHHWRGKSSLRLEARDFRFKE